METIKAKTIIQKGLAVEGWTGVQREAMETAFDNLALLEQIKGAYDDRMDDIECYEQLLIKIKDAFETKTSDAFHAYLHDLFTRQLIEDY